MGDDGRLLGTGLVALGGGIVGSAIGFVLATGADVGVGRPVLVAALGLSVFGTIGAALAVAGLTGRAPWVRPAVARTGALSCIIAATVVVNAPPPSDGPFRALFYLGGTGVALGGLTLLAAAVFENEDGSLGFES